MSADWKTPLACSNPLRNFFACQGGKSSFHRPLLSGYPECMQLHPGTNSRCSSKCWKQSDLYTHNLRLEDYLTRQQTIISSLVFTAGEQHYFNMISKELKTTEQQIYTTKNEEYLVVATKCVKTWRALCMHYLYELRTKVGIHWGEQTARLKAMLNNGSVEE